jgi:hypothetical protein
MRPMLSKHARWLYSLSVLACFLLAAGAGHKWG